MRLALIDEEFAYFGALFNAAQIPFAVLKGMALSLFTYPTRIERPFGDIDVLIPLDQLAAAAGTLRAAGFEPTEIRYPHSVRSAWMRPDAPISIDLHTALIPGDAVERTAEILSRTTSRLQGSVRLQLLSPEDHLLYLIRHGAVLHALDSPMWLLDLHWLIVGSGDFRWDVFFKRLEECRHAGTTHAAHLCLGLIQAAWDTPVPKGQGQSEREAQPALAEWFGSDPRIRNQTLYLIRRRLKLLGSLQSAVQYGLARRRRLRLEKSAQASI